jgi:uncharacterized protein DUF2795
MANPSFIEVQKFLAGIDYPADRDELVEHAQENGAPDEIVEALQSIADRSYDGPNAVSEQVAAKAN